MPDMLAQATAWLDEMRATHLSRQVTYRRGGDSVEIVATLGSTTYEIADEAGATIEAKATDFIVSAEDLAFNETVTLPQTGDRVYMAVGNRVRIFEVLDLAGGGRYQPGDPYGIMLRIHTKCISEEPLPVRV